MRHEILTPEWWAAAAVRALKTVCQSALGVLSGCVLFSEVNWAVVGSTALLSGVLSLLTSLAGLPEVDPQEIEYHGPITREDKENE